jgi:predicted metal-dependent HD superfamily phosphohydrolase
MAWLWGQWAALMDFYGVDGTLAEAVFTDLVQRYGENGRYYHNLRHIQNVLEAIDSAADYAEDLEAIKLAAWFHDVIYDVHRGDNEAQSALWAVTMLHKLGIRSATIAKVDDMIRATKHNRDCAGNIDCQIMLDADLATFASDWALQLEIEQAIRQEYAFVPDDAYREGRQVVLQHFLDRERIYFTDVMYAERETLARQNIARSIKALRDS